MSDIISSAKTELINCKTTGDIRRVSAKLFPEVKGKPIDCVVSACGELLEQRDWALGVIAYDFAYRVRKQYDDGTFAVFEDWLERYVRGWGDCDDFCTHAFGELIAQKPGLMAKVRAWTAREEFWMRRASAVVLFPSIKQGGYKETDPLKIADLLMMDKHKLVLQGYGWMLKELSKKEPQLVFDYLPKNKAAMPRTAFRYALEKMDEDSKRVLMGKEGNI